ncbi:MAG: alanine--tRNA ligase [Deferribacterota bacterium]|nr:alanine--tRNA ligase [Deferribacterota bacterium]
MKSYEIRRLFLDYFTERGHTEVASSSLIPKDDPTILFTNAGMNQFKGVFLGYEKRDYTRACSCQKVVRAGGKHNDLENVGKTARHHTFFEMLGNFSFGDYFKKEAINYAWDFITNHLKLDKNKLYITVYYDDEEAYKIWKDNIGVEEDKIYKMGEKENFWSMGDTGPCGPCSEIIIDQGPDVGCKRPDCDIYCECDRHLELWNLVFMQYNRDEDGSLRALPNPCIDTGLGLERVTAVIQKVKSNYDTDLFLPIINKIAKQAGVDYKEDEKSGVALRVIADHARAATFLIGDGVLPSNEFRGYVLRRIIRRALRYGKFLNLSIPFFCDICHFVIDLMKVHYSDLLDKKDFIINIVKDEELKFSQILESGLKLVNSLFESYKKTRFIPGKEIFKLYDTYGFPVDLFEDMASESGYDYNHDEFNRLMESQRNKAKSAQSKSVYIDNKLKLKKDRYISKFVGYNNYEITTRLSALIKDDKEVVELKEGEKGLAILEETPFYASAGGQISDAGCIEVKSGKANVLSVEKLEDNLILHEIIVEYGSLREGVGVNAKIDKEKRKEIEKHHTSTHLLHSSLRTLFGTQIRQCGSLVCDKYLRFDFNFNRALKQDELKELEYLVNKKIQENITVNIDYLPFKEAIASGAIGLFDEKYGEIVRVVEINDYSKELCGGCHVFQTGEIGFFKILSEGSVAAGIRRIEAVCGINAVKHITASMLSLNQASSILGCNSSEIASKVEELIRTNKELVNENNRLNEKLNTLLLERDIIKKAEKVEDFYLLISELKNIDVASMRNMVDIVKAKLKKCIVLFYSIDTQKNKIFILCGLTNNLLDRFDARDIVKNLSSIIDGGGGGKKELAQAGGKNINRLNDMIEEFYKLIGGRNEQYS